MVKTTLWTKNSCSNFNKIGMSYKKMRSKIKGITCAYNKTPSGKRKPCRRVFDLLMDGSTGLSGDAIFGFFQKGDERCAAGFGLGELQSGLHFGKHGAGSKLTLGDIFSGFVWSQIAEPALVGLCPSQYWVSMGCRTLGRER